MSGLDDLLAGLRAAPNLAGAACAGLAEVFDGRGDDESYADAEERHRRAQEMCEKHCPAAERCRSWLLESPRRLRPPGVVAGYRVDDRGLIHPIAPTKEKSA